MNRFFKLFTAGLGSKFATQNSYLNILSRLKHVATLPCEIRKSEKWRQSEICKLLTINHKVSTAKHLRSYKFPTESASERILKIA